MDEPTIAEAMASPKAKIFRTTPTGVAVYPHLLTYDQYQLDQNNKYECNTKLLLDPASPSVKEFVDGIDTMVSETVEAAKVTLAKEAEAATGPDKGKKKKEINDLTPYTPYDDEIDDDGEPTGKVIFKMKTVVAGTDKRTKQSWSREVAIFDSQNEKIVGDSRSNLKLWGGSKIAVALQIVPYHAPGLKQAGISLRITAVQVVELAGVERTASAYGFGSHDTGFQQGDTEGEEQVDAPSEEIEEEEF